MFDLFLSPDYAPFSIAFVVMLGIGLIEAIGLGLGHFDLDSDMDAHAGHDLLGWLGIGRGLPILVWLTALLACFTVAGFAIQQIVTALFGGPLHWGLASGGALLAGGATNSVVAAGLAKVFPSYESTAIHADDLLRHRGTVLEGKAARGRPARAKVVDGYGQAHYVMIEPHHDDDVIAQGETALLVRKEGQVFFAVTDAHSLLRTI